jgi:hypothetical protein
MRLVAISLHQPYASALLVPSLKVTETRHWILPERLRELIREDGGFPFVIHAAKRPVPRDLDDDLAGAMADHFGPTWRQDIPLGGNIGRSTMVSCAKMPAVMPAHSNDHLFGDWTPGRFGWGTRDPHTFAEPIPCIGRQGWFYVDIPEHA